MVGNLQNIFIEHNLNITNDFCHKIKINNFDPYNCIVVYCYKYTCVTYDCFVLQGHIYLLYSIMNRNIIVWISDTLWLGWIVQWH